MSRMVDLIRERQHVHHEEAHSSARILQNVVPSSSATIADVARRRNPNEDTKSPTGGSIDLLNRCY